MGMAGAVASHYPRQRRREDQLERPPSPSRPRDTLVLRVSRFQRSDFARGRTGTFVQPAGCRGAVRLHYHTAFSAPVWHFNFFEETIMRTISATIGGLTYRMPVTLAALLR